MCIKLAPILLFAYKRLDTLRQTVGALQQNYHASESELFIFSDGAKTSEEEHTINDIRTYIRTINGFKSINVFEAGSNKGLANSIIDGVNMIMQDHKKVIVLEDDLVTSPNFLAYMNQSLEFYTNNLSVFSVSGYTIPSTIPYRYEFDTFFLPRACSWGWGTWRYQWEKVDWEITNFSELRKNKTLIRAFNIGGSDLFRLLKKQMSKKVDSWAIRWCYHAFTIGAYTVYPVISKVHNIGFDETATHTYAFNRFNSQVDNGKKKTFFFPEEAKADSHFLTKFQSFYSVRSRAICKIKTYLKRANFYKIINNEK